MSISENDLHLDAEPEPSFVASGSGVVVPGELRPRRSPLARGLPEWDLVPRDEPAAARPVPAG